MAASSGAGRRAASSIAPSRTRAVAGASAARAVKASRRGGGWPGWALSSPQTAPIPARSHILATSVSRSAGFLASRTTPRRTRRPGGGSVGRKATMPEIVGTSGWEPPSSLQTSLLEFFHRLRDARVPVSMVEVLDAFECLRHVDLADRTQFRAALFTTLVKRPEDQQAFHVLFDVCFPLTRAPGAAASGTPAEAEAPEPPSDELLRALLDALRHDDEAAMRTLAGLAVDRFGGLEAQPEASERYYLYRILRQVELYRLLAMALGDQEDPDGAARHGREELARRIEEFRRLLAEQVRHRLSATVGAEQAAELYRER